MLAYLSQPLAGCSLWKTFVASLFIHLYLQQWLLPDMKVVKSFVGVHFLTEAVFNTHISKIILTIKI